MCLVTWVWNDTNDHVSSKYIVTSTILEVRYYWNAKSTASAWFRHNWPWSVLTDSRGFVDLFNKPIRREGENFIEGSE